MRASADDYLIQQQQILPSGSAWPRDRESTLSKLLLAFADGWAQIHNRMLDLAAESDPRSTLELLPEWEAEVGLPDPCTGQAEGLLERRDRVVARLTARGGQSKAYFIGLAARLGYSVTIEEHFTMTCVDPCDRRLNPWPWPRSWTVHAPAETIRELTCAGTSSEPLRTWGNQALECSIRRYAPAHTNVHFAYGV